MNCNYTFIKFIYVIIYVGGNSKTAILLDGKLYKFSKK